MPRLESGAYEQGLVLLTKHKEENFANIARGWSLLAPGGRWFAPAPTTMARPAWRSMSARRSASSTRFPSSTAASSGSTRASARRPTIGAACDAAAGRRRLLAEPARHLPLGSRRRRLGPARARTCPSDLAGHVADFGCGWGYLSRHVLDHCPGIARIDMIDAEHRAIEAARANVADPRATFALARSDQRGRAHDLRRHRLQSALPRRPRGRAGAGPGLHRGRRARAEAGRPLLHGRQPRPALRAAAEGNTSPRSRRWPTTTSSG